MGALQFRPQIEVSEDPEVVMYTRVGFSVMLSHRREFFALSNSKTLVSSGMLYVKDGYLHHEVTTESRSRYAYTGYHWKLSDIERMEIVHGNIAITRKDRLRGNTQENHYIDPGMRIILKNRKTLLTAMPDAEDFCARLSLHIDKLFHHKHTGTHRLRHAWTRQRRRYRLNAHQLHRQLSEP